MRYRPAVEPWTHQKDGMKFLRGRQVAAILMSMRTGKTKLTLDFFGELELAGLCQDVSVVAPAGCYRTWEGAALEHASLDLKNRLLIHVWESSGGAAHDRHLGWFMGQLDRPRLLIMNVEATSTVKRAREVLLRFCEQRISLCVYDEATGIKSPKSSRAKFAVREVKPRTNYRLILTGYPTPKSPLDAYMQFEFLDSRILGFNSYEAFAARHSIIRVIQGGRAVRLPDGSLASNADGTVRRMEIPVTVGYRDVPAVRRRIEGHSFRRRLEDCDPAMPAKMYSYRDVEWHPEQRRVYEELRKFATAQLSDLEGEQGFVTVQNVMGQLLRLHQVLCGHVVTEDGVRRDIPELRTESLLDLLEDYDGKAVIWCCYDYNIQKIAAAIEDRFKYKPARFWGGNRSTREEEERTFKTDPECRWIVGTPHAGRFGRDWREANLMVFFANSPDLEHRIQGEDRIQHVGNRVSKGYVDLRIPGNTVDVRWIQTLKEKKSMGDVITGDAWREWLR